jgi:hypothetical protein
MRINHFFSFDPPPHTRRTRVRDGVVMEDPWGGGVQDHTAAAAAAAPATAAASGNGKQPRHHHLTPDRPALDAAWTVPSTTTSGGGSSTSGGGTSTSSSSSSASSNEWADWLRRVSVELVRQSPSPALRPCAGLAQVCVFLCVWVGVYAGGCTDRGAWWDGGWSVWVTHIIIQHMVHVSHTQAPPIPFPC